MSDAEGSPSAARASNLTTALAFAVLWAAIDTARIRETLPPFSTFAALLGGAALTLGVVVSAARFAAPLGDGVRAVFAGGLAAAAPLAVVAARLEKSTHHRALGGVTFAVLASVVVLVASAVAARVFRVVRAGGSFQHLARAALVVIPLASAAWLVLSLRPLFSGSGGFLSSAAVDAATGGVLLVAALLLPPLRVSGGRAHLGTPAWLGAVVLGAVFALSSAPLRAALSERAPVAFGFGYILPSP